MIFDTQPGDVFCTKEKSWLSGPIRRAERYWSVDNEAEYTHAGLILNWSGRTYETLWWKESRNLFSDLAGSYVLVGRHHDMNPSLFYTHYPKFYREHCGGKYPLWRSLLFLLNPPLARYLYFIGRPVCSELVKKFVVQCGLCNCWIGATPDHVADMIHNFRKWSVVFEGILPSL